MYEVEVLIFGAGPAGAALACALASRRRVLLLDRPERAATKIGESLPGSARVPMDDLGLTQRFLRSGLHVPCVGNKIVWSASACSYSHGVFSPYGAGWHVDRNAFDAWLREEAQSRGASLLPVSQVSAVVPETGWRTCFDAPNGPKEVHARFIVDASGRASRIARRLGSKRILADRLVAIYVHGRDRVPDATQMTFVEAEESGWWYTARLPQGRRVLAFHTDADLAQRGLSASELLLRARQCSHLGALLDDCGFVAEGSVTYTAAHGARLDNFAGPGWLSVGDASMTLDPVSSQGIYHALVTAVSAASAIDACLSDDRTGIQQYCRMLREVYDAYRMNLAACYSAEQRWQQAPFWCRRRRWEHW